MAETLACRLCRNPVNADIGCDVCREWKRNLVVTSDAPADDAVDLGELAAETLGAMRMNLRAVKQVLRADPADASAARRLTSLSRSIASMVDVTRKVRKEGTEAIKTLPFVEKLEIFAAWFLELPPVHRAHVLSELNKASETLNILPPVDVPRLE